LASIGAAKASNMARSASVGISGIRLLLVMVI
jgi:hypothetical protein